jgi:D-alanine-D-alanine ligase
MARKLRISILFNEPVAGGELARQYVTENGNILKGNDRKDSIIESGHTHAVQDVPRPIDLSEVGVVEEMEDIKTAIDQLGYKSRIFNVNSDIFRLIDYLRAEKPDLIFNIVECLENESLQEMNVAGLYELLKIPYTGAGPLALGIALHKPRVKELLRARGIRTPEFQVFRIAEKISLKDGMTFPLIVKPSHEDGSVGISDASIVTTLADLRKRVQHIHHEFDQPALVEQYIEGRELNVAILGYKRPQVLPVSEIDFSGLLPGMAHIVSYEAKWLNGTPAYEGTRGVCPTKLPAGKDAELKRVALECFHLIGCRDYARVDFRLTPAGEAYVLEVNPNPDISDDAGFARSARTAGFTFPEIIGKIIESALERSR